MTGMLVKNRGRKLAVVLVLILGLAAAFVLTRDRSVEAASPPRVDPQLTGAAVAEELGLEGETDLDSKVTCESGFIVHDDIRYCLDGATSDPAMRYVYAWQIAGYPATDARIQYASALVDLSEALESTDAEDPAIFDLQARVKELKEAVSQETRVQE